MVKVCPAREPQPRVEIQSTGAATDPAPSRLPAMTMVVLASGSPRRLELLGQLGLNPLVIAPDIDESQLAGEPPAHYVNRLSLAKSLAVQAGTVFSQAVHARASSVGSSSPKRVGHSDTPGLSAMAADRFRPAADTDADAGFEPNAVTDAGAETDAGSERFDADADADRVVIIAADTIVVVEGSILGKPADAQEASTMLAGLSGQHHEVLTGVSVRAGPRTASAVVTTEVEFVDLDAVTIAWYVATGEPMDKAGAYAIQGHGGSFVRKVTGSVTNVIGLPLAETSDLLTQLGYSPNRLRPR